MEQAALLELYSLIIVNTGANYKIFSYITPKYFLKSLHSMMSVSSKITVKLIKTFYETNAIPLLV